MTNITAAIDSWKGIVTINIFSDDNKQTLTMRWCRFSDDGSTGFMASFIPGPVLVTEVAAEHLIRIILTMIIRNVNIDRGELSIFNHLGDELKDVEFIPPTFEGNEAETLDLIARQDRLTRIFGIYEETGMLNTDCIVACQEEGILDDFLCLVQLRASGLSFEIQRPSTTKE